MGAVAVSGLPRVVRVAAWGFGALLGLALATALAIIAWAEWQAAITAPGPVPTSFEIEGPRVGSAAGADPAGAPVLILLHGAGLNRHMWDAVRRGLDPRYRVIALDLPGHGARSGEIYSLPAARATVAAAARSVAPAPVLLVGDSLGGYSAMAAAEAVPREQLRGLVLAGCTSPRETSRLFAYLKNIVMVTTMRLFVDEPRFVGRALASLEVADGDARSIVAGGVSLRAVPFAERALLFTDFQATLARAKPTVLIVNGDLDQRAVAGEAGFAAAAASASVHHFQNTPHGVSMRRSAEFAGLLNRFAAQVPGTAPPR